MSGTIWAFGGKGGSGKTTVTSLVLRRLVEAGRKPILAVDADPNATLAMTLGVEMADTVADLRDRMGEAAEKVTEIPKTRLMDQYLAEILAEEVGFDLLAMGRPEGPRCYCYVNGLLRRYLKELRRNYAHVLVDCEAGMEYLSRLTVDDVDTLVMVAEATPVGLRSAARIADLADSLPVRVRRRVLVWNKVGGPGLSEEELARLGPPNVDATVRIPFDADVRDRCARGLPIDAEAGPEARAAVEMLVDCCLGLEPHPTPAVEEEPLR